MRQAVQKWVGHNGDGNPALDKEDVNAIKNIGDFDAPVKWWEQVR